jgi:hypothetical protein
LVNAPRRLSRSRLEQHPADVVEARGSFGEPRPHRRGIDGEAAVGGDRLGLFGNHGGLYYALPACWQMLSPLDGLSALLRRDHRVVLAELGSGDGDRAALLSTVERGSAAGVLGHSSNCC